MPRALVGLVAAVVAGARLGEHLGAGPAIAVLVLGLLGAVGALFLPRSPARLALAVAAVALLATASMQRALDGQAHSPLTRAAGRTRPRRRHGHAGRRSRRGAVRRARPRPRRTDRRAFRRRPRPCSSPPAATPPASCDSSSRATRWRCRAGSTARPASTSDSAGGTRWRASTPSSSLAFEPARSPLHRTANALRARVLAGGRHLAPTERALMAGFLLGDTRELPRDVDEQFRASGLTHLARRVRRQRRVRAGVARPLLRRLPLRAAAGRRRSPSSWCSAR